MNIFGYDILNCLMKGVYISQRKLSEQTGHSLGMVNKSLKVLLKNGYLTEGNQLTDKAIKEFEDKKPKNAIVLAAGFGMRMVPIHTETPKGLLQVNNELLIERVISQLHGVGIFQVYIVVGFMKERFDYLIDKYGVELIINTEYATKNNIHSLRLVLDKLSNSYIIPCDIWCKSNPFSKHELYSWYMINDLITNESTVKINRKKELVKVSAETGGNNMIGISYLLEEQASIIRSRIREFDQDKKYDHTFWEEALYHNNRMIIFARMAHSSSTYEINTYEQLRELDSKSSHLHSEIISLISDVLKVNREEIVDICILKKGMTNRSFQFSCQERRYIMRIPGEGTDKMINRQQEFDVYQTIADQNICDDVCYINPKNGYKITSFLDHSRNCNPFILDDVKKCMGRLKSFHESKLHVGHTFDIFEKIEFYESLWQEHASIYCDYSQTKRNVYKLKNYIDKQPKSWVLTHIDAVPDNFMFITNENGSEEIRLIDWEYAGMQDPHVDIAMFAIYSLYNRKQIDTLIDLYFQKQCEDSVRLKIYCYIACCGLLWSNWCEYKRRLNIEFGEYSIKQYRYAKDYYKYFITEIKTRVVLDEHE